MISTAPLGRVQLPGKIPVPIYSYPPSQVYNAIPSLSAVTGVSPQRYLWRASIVFHAVPRLLVAVSYRALFVQVTKND